MTRRPNFLFLFPDQHRPDWLGCTPALPLRTPHLDALAARGVRFANAVTPSPLCSPARACLATGRDYRRCGVIDNGQNTPLTLPTYYQHLRATGYQVCGTGKFDLHKPDHDWGRDGTHLLGEYGFTCGCDSEGKGDAITSYVQNGMQPKGPYMQFLAARGLAAAHLAMYQPHLGKPGWLNFPAVTELPDDAYCDNWVGENAARFLQAFPHGQPWHLVVNFVGPHGPFDVTRAMHERWHDAAIPPPVDHHDPDTATVMLRRRYYAAMIENIDAQCGRLIDLVRARGELDTTIIIYASDHGEMLGDHDRWAKSTWYRPSSGVPLIIAGPGILGGVVSDALVALHDVAATVLDYAGAAPLPDSDARSLRAVLDGSRQQHRSHLYCGLKDWDMICDARYVYVRRRAAEPLLFDRLDDPHELRNAAAEHVARVRELDQLLSVHLSHAS